MSKHNLWKPSFRSPEMYHCSFVSAERLHVKQNLSSDYLYGCTCPFPDCTIKVEVWKLELFGLEDGHFCRSVKREPFYSGSHIPNHFWVYIGWERKWIVRMTVMFWCLQKKRVYYLRRPNSAGISGFVEQFSRHSSYAFIGLKRTKFNYRLLHVCSLWQTVMINRL